MTVTYELRALSRNVNVDLNPEKPGETPVGKHTGYDLITIHEDGSRTIQYIDLYSISLWLVAGYVSFIYLNRWGIFIVKFSNFVWYVFILSNIFRLMVNRGLSYI